VLYPEEEEAGLVELIIGFAPQASCPNVESEVLLLQDGPVVDHAMPWLCGGENRPAGRKTNRECRQRREIGMWLASCVDVICCK
jgi:hypothetical protein